MIQLWKRFDTTELSHSSIHHLLAIHDLIKENGYARSIDIAKYLEITRGSASKTLHKIKDKGFIVEDSNKFYRLAEKGKGLVNSVLSKRRIAENFFTHQQTVSKICVIDKPNNEAYDLIMVIVQMVHINNVLPVLSEFKNAKSFLFIHCSFFIAESSLRDLACVREAMR